MKNLALCPVSPNEKLMLKLILHNLWPPHRHLKIGFSSGTALAHARVSLFQAASQDKHLENVCSAQRFV